MIGSQLQTAMRSVLVGANVAGGRIYDRVAKGAKFPYVTIGDEQTVDDGTQCADMFEVFADVHVWSRATGTERAEAKAIGEAIRQALAADLTVADYHVILSEFETSRVFREQDGLTAHAVLTFRFLLQPE